MPAASRLALFDLDHTLLPLDSEYEWARYLVAVGGADAAEIDAHNARWLAAYQAGRLDFAAHARFALGLLARHPRQRLTQWRAEFMRDVIVPAIPPATRDLLARHLGAGDLCCIVTATCRFITEPIARELGVPHLLAVEAEHDVHGEFTGALAGVPAYGPGKVLRVLAWLDTLGLAHTALAQATFYSDSRNDLPLLESVGHPVAVNPDPTLLDAAGARGWPVMQLFAAPGMPAA